MIFGGGSESGHPRHPQRHLAAPAHSRSPPRMACKMTSALHMRVKLEQLRKSHGLAAPVPVTVPLAPPTQRAQVLTGVAASTTVDLVHQKFRGWCFRSLRARDVPLLYKHQGTAVGTIDSLSYDNHGN